MIDIASRLPGGYLSAGVGIRISFTLHCSRNTATCRNGVHVGLHGLPIVATPYCFVKLPWGPALAQLEISAFSPARSPQSVRIDFAAM